MTLQISLESFAAAVAEHIGKAKAYVSVGKGLSTVTAGDPKSGLILQASTTKTADELTAILKAQGLDVDEGAWTVDGLEVSAVDGAELWVAAVAYTSSERRPGLWVDAFPTAPSTGDVLTALYDEFCETGELIDMSLEEFIRVAAPNVVVLGPDELARYAHKRAPRLAKSEASVVAPPLGG